MSIVADATARHEQIGQAVLAAACLGLSVPLVVRWVRRGPLNRPERLPHGTTAWPLAMALGWGLLVWIMVPYAYVSWRGPALHQAATQPATAPSATPATMPTAEEIARPASPPDGTFDLAGLPPRDVAFLAAVPNLAVFIALVALDRSIFGGGLRPLGFSARQAAAGLATGAKFSIAFVPLVLGSAVLTDWIYQWFDYTHPREHDLLRVLGESVEPIVRVALAAGAVVVAPLSEELLFRGHGQTILRAGLARLGGYHPTDPDGPAPSVPPAWATWGAIVLASALFAAVHDPWTWPPIFLLSMGLGWAYERTGNLWAPVAIHAAFNAVSTLIFLAGAGAN